ncbi:MAG TPA: signal peptidase II [Caulobacteraceae bacterium]|jgi:signal peptidase II|nr:signal peptidase II [Caulobacteraceae bacterium]
MADSQKRPWLATLAYGLAALVIVLDQLAKHWITVTMHMEPGSSITVTPFLNFTLVLNRGVSFGLFRSPEGTEIIRWALALFSAVVAIALAIWVRGARRIVPAVGIGLIIGGALGNLGDRIRLGRVVDFIDVSTALPWFPWVMNIADICVNVGVALLLLDTFLVRDKSGAAAKSPI